MPLLFIVSALLTLLYATPALAHVKWFVPLGDHHGADAAAFSLADPAVQAWALIAVALVSASVYLDSRLPSLPLVDSKVRHLLVDLLRTLTGLSLVLSAWSGSLIAPHYQWEGADVGFLLALEALVGLMLLFRPLVFAASLLLLVLYGALALRVGGLEVL
ncbi:MAG: hypothetical protein RLZZ227_2135 [Pseudomonadota bacterium]|jgi:hypothetical protein